MAKNRFEATWPPKGGSEGSAEGQQLPFSPEKDQASATPGDTPTKSAKEIIEEINATQASGEIVRELNERFGKVPNVPEASLEPLLPKYWEDLSEEIERMGEIIQDIINEPSPPDPDGAYDDATNIQIEGVEDSFLDFWRDRIPDNLKPLLATKLAENQTAPYKEALALLKRVGSI